MMMILPTFLLALSLSLTVMAGRCPSVDILESKEVENLIGLIQDAKDKGLRVVNIDEDKGEIDTRKTKECDNDNDIFFVPNEYHSPPIFTKLCAGSCSFSEGCAVTRQEVRRETVLVYRKVYGVFKPTCKTVYFPRHKDCECQVE